MQLECVWLVGCGLEVNRNKYGYSDMDLYCFLHSAISWCECLDFTYLIFPVVDLQLVANMRIRLKSYVPSFPHFLCTFFFINGEGACQNFHFYWYISQNEDIFYHLHSLMFRLE